MQNRLRKKQQGGAVSEDLGSSMKKESACGVSAGERKFPGETSDIQEASQKNNQLVINFLQNGSVSSSRRR